MESTKYCHDIEYTLGYYEIKMYKLFIQMI